MMCGAILQSVCFTEEQPLALLQCTRETDRTVLTFCKPVRVSWSIYHWWSSVGLVMKTLYFAIGGGGISFPHTFLYSHSLLCPCAFCCLLWNCVNGGVRKYDCQHWFKSPALVVSSRYLAMMVELARSFDLRLWQISLFSAHRCYLLACRRWLGMAQSFL